GIRGKLVTGVQTCALPIWTAKNSRDWPMKSPSAVKALAAPIAAPFVSVGRMIETTGNFLLRKMVGSGMIRLVWKSSLPKGRALKIGRASCRERVEIAVGAM